MRQFMAVVSIIAACSVSAAQDSPRSLDDAVAKLNREAQADSIGKSQPPLTDDEVVAAIRGWVREQIPATDEVYKTYQEIAETRRLPAGARLSFTTRWTGYKGYDFNVWWVDLSIMTSPNTGYGFRIRDQKINSQRSSVVANGVSLQQAAEESPLPATFLSIDGLKPGRFRTLIAPTSPPSIILCDTATGQCWSQPVVGDKTWHDRGSPSSPVTSEATPRIQFPRSN